MDLDGKQLLKIVADHGNNLVVQQEQPQAANGAALVVVLGLIIAAVCAWQRRWVVFGIAILGTTIFAVNLHKSDVPPSAYRLEVDDGSRRITWNRYQNGKEEETHTVHADDLTSADMRFSAPGGGVVLIGKDGQQIFPLGPLLYQNEPVQFIVVDRIRRLIGQPPVTHPSLTGQAGASSKIP